MDSILDSLGRQFSPEVCEVIKMQFEKARSMNDSDLLDDSGFVFLLGDSTV
jgi:hypothetical protein